MRILVLGGTGEARALAARLVADGVPVTSSLAGRVTNPALPVGEVRIGGFGGADGLATYLRENSPDAVVDATHPFAATITANAARACAATGTPLVVLRRPGWTERPGDDWRRVPTVVDAAAVARDSGPGTVFLTTGRRDLAAFAADADHDYVVRTVDPPDVAMPPRTTLLLDRGPYDLDGERALMRAHGVRLLVTKDSGGALTVAKLDAARELGVPVVVVDRPPPPDGVEVVASVDAALSALPGTAAG
ncbi:cobalt-precorrin-6A reductase [Jatrophihabitans fulvus]